MFSQGRNRRRKGYSGDTFYWFTPLTPEGDRGSAFPLVRRMSRIIGASESLILQADRKSEICVLFYPPYYATELERPEDGASGLLFNYAPIRRAAWFDGLLKALQVLNIDYDMADLTRSTPESLGKYRQVWAFCTDEMNASDQQTLAGYAQEGGNLVVFPNLPSREMNGTPSRVLRDSVTLKPVSFETIDSPLIDIFGFRDIKCANPQVVFPEESPERAEIIARTIKGSPCGFSERVGKGTVTVLGTWLGFDTEGHKPVYETLAGRSGARLRTASSPNGNITVRERFTPGGQGLLFIGNYYNEEQTGKVEYTHPNTGEQFTIPFNAGEFQWPPLYAVLSPLCLEIKKGLSILHSTSDILGHVLSGDNHIRIFIHGDRDLPGEIVLEGELCHKISKIRIDNQDTDYMLVDRQAVIRYSHKSGKESSIEITL
jgi:beta-galactosidase